MRAFLVVAAVRFELTCHLESRTPFTELDALYWAVATPGSGRYLRFLDRGDLAAQVGGTEAAVQEAVRYLEALNGTQVAVSALRDRVTASFEGTDPLRWTPRGLPHKRLQPPGVALVTRRDFGRLAEAPRVRLGAAGSTYSVSNQKRAYRLPVDRAATNPRTTQMVWGPGTFGFSREQLEQFKEAECPGLNVDKVVFDTKNHGKDGGDNFMEGTLDTHMTAAFGMNATTVVSNTNTSMSTEEGSGFGLAMLDFLTELAGRDTVPQVLSLSLGSLSAHSCNLLCDKAAATGEVTRSDCEAYLQTQRQVCMFTSEAETDRINAALLALGLRGVSVFGSSGDGGSHWSFQPFQGEGALPRVLNKVGCEFQFPIFPSPSPYIVSVGGTSWKGGDGQKPVMWEGSGGGFAWELPRPAHQRAAVERYLQQPGLPPSSSFNASGRAYPDISAVAVMGTSQSSPTFAGIFTLLTDARLNAGLPPLGPLGPRIWDVAQRFPGEAFEDVTEGNSKTTCASGFPAAGGWDPTTGWGRPVWPGLLKHFGSDSFLQEVLV